jgi:hypothetical protein
MSFKDYFDITYCINLDKRTDRWEQAQVEFKKIGISVRRVSAIDGSLYPEYAGLKPGANGCRLSHLKVLNMAIKNQYDKIFIAEDDIIFDDNFNEKFESLEEQIPNDWDLIYLCANPHTGQRKFVNKNIYKMTGGYSSHSIIMRNTFFKKAIDAILSMPYQVDVVYGELQKHFNCYITIPHLAFQSNGFSDVENSNVDYSFFRQNGI